MSVGSLEGKSMTPVMTEFADTLRSRNYNGLHLTAQHAESKPDFIHKLAIAQKEINETLYWFELLFKTDYQNQQEYDSLTQDATELLKLLTSIIKTTKSKINN